MQNLAKMRCNAWAMLQHFAKSCCNDLDHIATSCKVALQHVATHSVSLQGVLQRFATEAGALCKCCNSCCNILVTVNDATGADGSYRILLHGTYATVTDTPLRGSTGIARKVGRKQRSAAMTILGAMRTSPLDSLEVHSFLLPAPLLIQDILYRSALRLARLPQNHPPHTKMKWIECHDVKHHRSALHCLIHTLQVKPSKIETSILYALHPGSPPPSTSQLPQTTRKPSKTSKRTGTKTRYSQTDHVQVER